MNGNESENAKGGVSGTGDIVHLTVLIVDLSMTGKEMTNLVVILVEILGGEMIGVITGDIDLEIIAERAVQFDVKTNVQMPALIEKGTGVSVELDVIQDVIDYGIGNPCSLVSAGAN